jgi:hypothetical protein
MDDNLDFYGSWDNKTPKNSKQILYFQRKHPVSGFVSEKLHYMFEYPHKLSKLHKNIGQLAKMLRHLSTPSDLSLEDEIILMNLQTLSVKTNKPIADILKEKIENLNEDANNIYIPLFEPGYHLMRVLIEFQDEAPPT